MQTRWKWGKPERVRLARLGSAPNEGRQRQQTPCLGYVRSGALTQPFDGRCNVDHVFVRISGPCQARALVRWCIDDGDSDALLSQKPSIANEKPLISPSEAAVGKNLERPVAASDQDGRGLPAPGSERLGRCQP